MQAIPLPDETFDRLTFEASQPDRTPGLHVSSIIYDIQKRMDKDRYDEDRFDESVKHLYRQVGFAFEDCIERSLNHRRVDIVRPPELEMDGIYLSPDGMDPMKWMNDEIKFTWKSSNDAPHHPKFWGWRSQFMAYARALGTDRTVLRAAFVNGNYKDYVPQYKVWELRFTKQEIEANWKMLLKHAEEAGLR